MPKYSTNYLFLLLALVFSTPTLADVHKWKDANGKIHYGDAPNMAGTEKIKTDEPLTEDQIANNERIRGEMDNSVRQDASLAFATSGVKSGDKVILIRAMDDGVTYYVRTPTGIEIWKDRDLYHFAGIEETCTVIKSSGSEVLLYVPIMNAKYWFTVEKVKK